MYWQDGEQIRQALEAAYNHILVTRMSGMPVVNSALTVEAVDFTRNDDWLGVLITPWSMNLLLLPGKGSAWTAYPAGHKFEHFFPYGCFEFTAAHETAMGVYAQCSLFSPMFQFADQPAAREAAHAALQALLTSPAPATISRRDLLRGKLGKPNPT
jgi:[NiFe] hydrogenase assembly HybE family chaperone